MCGDPFWNPPFCGRCGRSIPPLLQFPFLREMSSSDSGSLNEKLLKNECVSSCSQLQRLAGSLSRHLKVKSAPSVPISFSNLCSRGSIVPGSGMLSPQKNLLALKICMYHGNFLVLDFSGKQKNSYPCAQDISFPLTTSTNEK